MSDKNALLADLHKTVSVVFVEVTDGNLNGDPQGGNAPRSDEYSGHGLISDVSIKRDIREALVRSGQQILIEKGVPLAVKKEEFISENRPVTVDEGGEEDTAASAKTGAKGKGKGKGKRPAATAEDVSRERLAFCKRFADVRFFGAVLGANATADLRLDNIRGCVNISFGRSIDPVQIMDHQITRCTVENDKTTDGGMNQTMGQKPIIPYGLYRFTVTVDWLEAAKNGFTNEDLEFLKDALRNLYQYRPSASKGPQCGSRAILTFNLASAGVSSLSTVQVMDHVKVIRTDDQIIPRKFSDYRIQVDHDLPEGVTLDVWKQLPKVEQRTFTDI